MTVKKTVALKMLLDKEKWKYLQKVLSEEALTLYAVRCSVRKGKYELASRQCKNAGVLAEALGDQIDEYKALVMNRNAEKYYLKIMSKLNIDVKNMPATTIVEKIENKRVKSRTARSIRKYLKVLNSRYSNTAFYIKNKLVIAELDKRFNRQTTPKAIVRNKVVIKTTNNSELVNELKNRIGISDDEAEKLVPIIKDLK